MYDMPRYVVVRDCVKYLKINDKTKHGCRLEVLMAINTQYNIEQIKEIMHDFFRYAWELNYEQCIKETNKIVRCCSDLYDVYVTCYKYLMTQIPKWDEGINRGPAKMYLKQLHDLFDVMYKYGERMLGMNNYEVW